MYQKCPVCNGLKIINEQTGLPPEVPMPENLMTEDEIENQIASHFKNAPLFSMNLSDIKKKK
jgi:hypothetical protein